MRFPLSWLFLTTPLLLLLATPLAGVAQTISVNRQVEVLARKPSEMATLIRQSPVARSADRESLASYLDDSDDSDTKSEKDTPSGKDKNSKENSKDNRSDRAEIHHLSDLSLSNISIDITPREEKTPRDVAGTAFAAAETMWHAPEFQRDVVGGNVSRVAPWVAYNPLYFEDASLERHGHHCGHLEPFVSAVKFYGRIPLMPYMVGAQHPYECVYSAGHARPGDCTPHFFTMPRRSKLGLFYQSVAVASGVLLIP